MMRHFARLFFKWFFHILRGVFLRRGRFLRLNPAFDFFKKTYFFDRQTRQFFSVYTDGLTDHITADQIYSAQDYDFKGFARSSEIETYYNQLIADGKTPLLLDCGANIGLASHYFARLFPKAYILCIEPDAQNMIKARCNNPQDRIRFLEGAVGSKNASGHIADPNKPNNAYQIIKNKKNGAQAIPIWQIDRLIALYGEDYVPFLIKIDIEGFEADLFASHTDWIKKFPLLIIELHDWLLPNSANSQNFLTAIAKEERDFLYRGENIFSFAKAPYQTETGKSPIMDPKPNLKQ